MSDKLPDKWWETIDRTGPNAGHLRLAMLAERMREEGYDIASIISMLEKPWKWTAEMQRVWVGMPTWESAND
jgi:hypothetical protein